MRWGDGRCTFGMILGRERGIYPFISTATIHSLENLRFADLTEHNIGTWNLSLIHSMFNPRDLHAILSIISLYFYTLKRISWFGDWVKMVVILRSTYYFIKESMIDNTSGVSKLPQILMNLAKGSIRSFCYKW